MSILAPILHPWEVLWALEVPQLAAAALVPVAVLVLIGWAIKRGMR